MATLSEPAKLFIVHHLAMFYTPTETKIALSEQFGFDVTLDQIIFYDPTSAKGSRDLSQKFKDEFKAVRERFKSEIYDIAIANKAFRLRELNALYSNKKTSPVVRADFLEQAAKEEGGLFTNKRDVTSGGQPITPAGFTDALLRAYNNVKPDSNGESTD